jgi:osmotically-inducible protein OsmY
MNTYQQYRAQPVLPTKSLEDEDLAVRVGLYLQHTRPELRGVNVAVQHGFVHLSGAVTTFHLRQLALAAACRVAGVRQVIDEIVVATLPAGPWRIDRPDGKMGPSARGTSEVKLSTKAEPT